MHTDTSLSLYLLLSSFWVFLSHVHYSSCFRPVALVTMQTLEVFCYLIGSPPMFAGFTIIRGVLILFPMTLAIVVKLFWFIANVQMPMVCRVHLVISEGNLVDKILNSHALLSITLGCKPTSETSRLMCYLKILILSINKALLRLLDEFSLTLFANNWLHGCSSQELRWILEI